MQWFGVELVSDKQGGDVIDDAGEEHRAADIERRRPGRPFQRMGSAAGGAQGHDAGDIECHGESEF